MAEGAECASTAAPITEPCPSRGPDTNWALLQASLRAEHEKLAKPLFLTLSGDLMAHNFDCRFKTLAPKATAKEYSEFAAKTVAFVALQLKQTFPGVPLYIALGNNDSGCADYREDEGSVFLQADAKTLAASVENAGAGKQIVSEAGDLGDYTVLLPKPISPTRLIVFQDIFAARVFKTCGDDKATTALAEKQIGWLLAQLSKARDAHEHVWVMAHMPPGIDIYNTMKSKKDVCGGEQPTMFLSSNLLGRTIGDFGDIITLALFGHLHTNEMRLYSDRAGKPAVPGKLVPSISPVNGNNPAFVVAAVDTQTSGLKDYAVIAAKDATGSAWSEEYRFSKVYGQSSYSAATLDAIMKAFAADATGVAPMSHSYQQNFFTGDTLIHAAAMQLFWPQTVCSMTHSDVEGYRACACRRRLPRQSSYCVILGVLWKPTSHKARCGATRRKDGPTTDCNC